MIAGKNIETINLKMIDHFSEKVLYSKLEKSEVYGIF